MSVKWLIFVWTNFQVICGISDDSRVYLLRAFFEVIEIIDLIVKIPRGLIERFDFILPVSPEALNSALIDLRGSGKIIGQRCEAHVGQRMIIVGYEIFNALLKLPYF